MYTTGEGVILRDGPSTDANNIERLPFGTQVTETERFSDGWSAVVYNGKSGFIFNEFLSPQSAKTKYIAGNDINFRKNPYADAELIQTFAHGTQVLETRAADDFGWCQVFYNGKTGYVSSTFLSDTKPAPPSDGASGGNKKYTNVGGNGVNFRSSPVVDPENFIEVLPLGTRVTVTEVLSDGWSAVLYNGTSGYIKSEFLSDSAPKLERFTLEKVRFRTGPSESADIMETLPAGTAIMELGRLDEGWSLVSYNGKTGYIFNEFIGTKEAYNNNSKSSSSSSSPAREVSRSAANVTYNEISASGIELVDWQSVKSKGLFPIGVNATVHDVWTGIKYNIRSFSNGNHADVEPVTTQDTENMKKTYGGQWSWDTRPVWVTINGRTYAASISGMPHGGGVISGNGMDGQVCLHFRGSLTHNGNRSHENEHQASVTAAWNAANR